MNKRITLAKIQAIANELDNNGLYAQADSLTQVMVKIAANVVNVVDVANLQSTQSNAQGDTTFTLPSGEEIVVPSVLLGKNPLTIKGKTYTLGYDSGTKNFVWYDKSNMRDFYPVDSKGNMLERRQKSPWRLDKALGLKLPNAKLPRITNLEERLRKDVVQPFSHKIRDALGNPIRDNITKPITGVLGRAGEQLGIQSPGRKSPEEADLAFSEGESENRDTQPPVKKDDVIPTPEPPGPTPEPTPGPTPGPTPQPVDEVIKGRGAEIKNINSPNDLLFWCMSVGTNNSYSTELAKDVRTNPTAYYNRKNQTGILNWIVTMAESPYVAKLNSRIKGYRKDAIQLLYSKIRGSK
jgi:hypothetical protein